LGETESEEDEGGGAIRLLNLVIEIFEMSVCQELYWQWIFVYIRHHKILGTDFVNSPLMCTCTPSYESHCRYHMGVSIG
jgi:hypothetical protein